MCSLCVVCACNYLENESITSFIYKCGSIWIWDWMSEWERNNQLSIYRVAIDEYFFSLFVSKNLHFHDELNNMDSPAAVDTSCKTMIINWTIWNKWVSRWIYETKILSFLLAPLLSTTDTWTYEIFQFFSTSVLRNLHKVHSDVAAVHCIVLCTIFYTQCAMCTHIFLENASKNGKNLAEMCEYEKCGLSQMHTHT